jgi:hypothetical protein
MKKVHKKIIETREKYFNKTLQYILLVLLVVYTSLEIKALFTPYVVVIDNVAVASTQVEEKAATPAVISSDEGHQAPLADISENDKTSVSRMS